MTLDFAMSFEVVDQETMAVAFDPEIPPLLTSSSGPFTFDGQTMTIVDENAMFDFEDGNGAVPVTAVTTLVMTDVVVADFEGSWEAASFVVTSQDDPAVTLDVIALGVALAAGADADGNVTGQAELPEALGGPLTLDFAGVFDVVDQETMTVSFDPDIPPLLTSFTGPFTFDGQTLTIVDENTVFDFDDGNGEVTATAVTTLVMTS